MKTYEAIADQLFGDSTGVSRGGLEQIYECPNCGKNKLSVNIENGGYRCWSQPDCEDYKGNIKRLYDGEISKDGGARLRAAKAKAKSNPNNVQTLDEIEAYPITEDSLEWLYLTRKRGMSDQRAREVISFYDLRMSDQYRYRNQLIIPIYDDGYRGYQRRYLSPLPNGIRYMNGKGLQRMKTIYNFDQACDYLEIWATEGIFSAYPFGRSGVATFGKEITRVQAARFASSGKTIVVALDGGELLAELKFVTMLRSFGAKVDRVELPNKKDPDDLDKEERLQKIINDTRETVNDSWIARQKAKLIRLSVYGEISIPRKFFDQLERVC